MYFSFQSPSTKLVLELCTHVISLSPFSSSARLGTRFQKRLQAQKHVSFLAKEPPPLLSANVEECRHVIGEETFPFSLLPSLRRAIARLLYPFLASLADWRGAPNLPPFRDVCDYIDYTTVRIPRCAKVLSESASNINDRA